MFHSINICSVSLTNIPQQELILEEKTQDWGDGSVCEVFAEQAWGVQSMGSIPTTHISQVPWNTCKPSTGQQKWKDHWSLSSRSLVKLVSSRLIKRPCLKESLWEIYPVDPWIPHACACMYTHTPHLKDFQVHSPTSSISSVRGTMASQPADKIGSPDALSTDSSHQGSPHLIGNLKCHIGLQEQNS